MILILFVTLFQFINLTLAILHLFQCVLIDVLVVVPLLLHTHQSFTYALVLLANLLVFVVQICIVYLALVVLTCILPSEFVDLSL